MATEKIETQVDEEKTNPVENLGDKCEVVITFKGDADSALDEDDSTDDDWDPTAPAWVRGFHKLYNRVGGFIDTHKFKLRCMLIGLAVVLALGYCVWALVVSAHFGCQDPRSLVALVSITVTCIAIWRVRKLWGDNINKWLEVLKDRFFDRKTCRIIKIGVILTATAGVITILLITTWQAPRNMVALMGILFFIAVMWLFSAHPRKVNWRPVLCGLCLQFYFATIFLRFKFGHEAFRWVGEKVSQFLAFTDYGSKFVFGEGFEEHFFAFKVLPVIIFFSCAINVLYYLGFMQLVISKIGWVLKNVLGTTDSESVVASGNIFIGMSEAPIMVRPFLNTMTHSELNTIMTCGFATIAGGVMAAYISFGVPPEHLLCASVMNAPGALAIAKLLYPETEKSRIRGAGDMNFDEKKETNIVEAAAAGASSSVKLVAYIGANMLAFLALLAFVNAALSWFGGFLCYPELSFQVICSYLFMPVAYLMGVTWEDTGVMGELIGTKTFLNEFIAYKQLTEYMENRAACAGEMISIRTEIIATYALCGFANISGIGIELGALGAMAPSRRTDLANIVVRSLLGGVITGLMTASMAGLLIVDPPVDLCLLGDNSTLSANVTMATDMFIQNVTMTTNNTSYILNATLGS